YGARLWHVPAGRQLVPAMRHSGPVTGIAFSPDGKTIATADEAGCARLFDSAPRRLLAPPLLHQGVVGGGGFSADGKTLLSLASRDTSWTPSGGTGEVRIWDAATGKPTDGPLPARLFLQPQGNGGQGPVNTVAFSADGQRLFAGSGQLGRVWDT